MNMSRIWLVVCLLGACDSNSEPEPEGPDLAGLVDEVLDVDEQQILLSAPTVNGASFGDSLIVYVSGALRGPDGESVNVAELKPGAQLEGRLVGICVDTDPRRCRAEGVSVQ